MPYAGPHKMVIWCVSPDETGAYVAEELIQFSFQVDVLVRNVKRQATVSAMDTVLLRTSQQRAPTIYLVPPT